MAQTNPRNLTLMSQETPDPSELEYPFTSLLDPYGGYDMEPTPIPGQPEESIGAFPKNIAEYYWCFGGTNDDAPWRCFCRLDTGVFVFYIASCDYTGFDCQGDMKVWASRDPSVLIQYAMSDEDYMLYRQDCKKNPFFATAEFKADLMMNATS